MFSILATKSIPHLDMTATLLQHDCGLQVLALDCPDNENLCATAFLTIPSNSTGVQHIIEHCVCEGSLNYPVKSPFSELDRTSMATLLNAFTYNDHTVYPFASTNQADFFNLWNVYWDCVFHPTFKPETFHQEGWHLEWSNPKNFNSKLLENGIVLNEMKAEMADLDAIVENEILKLLIPKSTLAHNSGGTPEQIVKLDYKNLLKYYKDNYSPAKARVLLYGNIPLQKKLDFIEKQLESMHINTPAIQKPRPTATELKAFTKPRRKTVKIVPEFNDRNSDAWTIAWLAVPRADQVQKLIAELIDSILFDNDGAPLKMAILESELADDLSAISGFNSDAPELVFTVAATGTNSKNTRKLKKIVLDTLEQFVKAGPTQQQLEAALRQLQVEKLEINNQILYTLIDNVFDAWLRDENPIEALDSLKQLEQLQDILENNPEILQQFVKERILDNQHCAEITFIADKTLARQRAEEEAIRLHNLKTALSADQKKTIAQDQAKLQELQAKQDSQEALDTLPKLKRSDISPYPIPVNPINIAPQGQVPILSEAIPTNKINYLKIAFDISNFEPEDLEVISFFVMMLNHLGTEKLDYAQFDERLAACGAAIEADYAFNFPAIPQLKPSAILTFKLYSLDQTWQRTMDCLDDRLHNTVFTEHKRILDLLRQRWAKARQNLLADAHAYAKTRAAAGLAKQTSANETWAGLTHVAKTKSLANPSKGELDCLIGKFERLFRTLSNATPLLVSHVGPENARDQLLERFSGIACQPKEFPGLRETDPFLQRRIESFAINGQVGSIALAFKAPDFFSPHTAAFATLAELLDTGPVWENIRIQGGAYGASCQYLPYSGLMIFSSARDPNPSRSLEAVHSILKQKHNWTQRDLDGAIISQLKDAPMRPAARRDFILHANLAGLSYEIRTKYRQNLLNLTLDDLRAAEQAIDPSNANACIIGPKRQIQNLDASTLQLKHL